METKNGTNLILEIIKRTYRKGMGGEKYMSNVCNQFISLNRNPTIQDIAVAGICLEIVVQRQCHRCYLPTEIDMKYSILVAAVFVMFPTFLNTSPLYGIASNLRLYEKPSLLLSILIISKSLP